MTNEFVVPVINKFGSGSIEEVPALIAMSGGSKALILTDKNLMDCGVAEQVLRVLARASLPYVVFCDVQPNPSKENVYDALELYKNNACDCLVSIGGGSPADCGKAVGILAANGGEIEDYTGGNRSLSPSVPLIAVNTTAGTASEISRAYIISDEQKKEKLIAKDIHALPFASVNDPKLMLGLPAKVTAATGMDALTHAVESYVSNASWLLTRQLAAVSVRLVLQNLRQVIASPQDVTLREAMIVAQTTGGMAFCNSGVGIAHSIAHALGASYNLPHGLCTAIALPPVMKYNRRITEDQYAQLSRDVLPVETHNKTDKASVDLLIAQIEKLSEDVGTNPKLSTLGVKEADLKMIAEKALRDGNTARNPVAPSLDDLLTILGDIL